MTPEPSQSSSPVSTPELVIVPGQSVGEVRGDSTEASLKATYGEDQVRSESLMFAEGMERPGIVVFPDDPAKRVEVLFGEANPDKIELIRVHGEGSIWQTPQGVKVGTSLKELEQINGKPFVMLGLGWDYGGGVTDWQGGALEGLSLRLEAIGEGLDQEAVSKVSGDREVSSDDPAMQIVNPRVTQITVQFPFE